MPFTASHPAAVLPLLGTPLPTSALVIGSIVPDLSFYLPVPVPIEASHTFTATIGMDLLLGAAVFASWQWLLRPAVVALAPDAVAARLDVGSAGLRHHLGTLPRQVAVVAALVIGAVTHVCWDSLTHAGYWGPRHIPWLAARHGPLAGYDWLQHLSTVLGLAVLVWWCVRWVRRTPAGAVPLRAWTTTTRRALGWLLGAAWLMGTGCGFAVGLRTPDGINGALFYAAVDGMRAAGAVLVAIAAVKRWRSRVRPARSAS